MKKNMRKSVVFYTLGFVLFFVPAAVFTQTEFIGRSEVGYINWGGVDNGWNNVFTMENVKLSRGPLGRLDIVLADNSPVSESKTEVLMQFDDCTIDSPHLQTQYYRVHEFDVFPSQKNKKFGSCSAGFFLPKNVIRLEPLGGSIFSSKGPLESFTIDFFLSPISLYDGSVIFSWHAPVVSLDGDFTGLKAFFKEGKLHWLFENVFTDRDGNLRDVIIGETAPTALGEWHHHAVYYDADSGLLTLYFDGKENNLQWVTDDGTEQGTLLQGAFSQYLQIPVSIGDDYHGFVDEFRISRGLPRFYLGLFRDFGVVTSDILTLEGKGAKIVKFIWDSAENNGTAVRLYYRTSKDYFRPFDGAGRLMEHESSGSRIPEWIPVRNNDEIDTELSGGRYYQWKAELYGTGGLFSPSLLSLKIMIEFNLPPLPPTVLKAEPLNGGVKLSWIGNKEDDIQGYSVYYGTSTRFYFGKGANRGDSPLFVGNTESVDIMGLKNEQVYFFSLTAVDEADQESGFSRELIVRPSSIYGSD
jgi:hypothetical protein